VIYYIIIIIIADDSSDDSNEEQNVFVLRYVSQNKGYELFEIKERFIESLNFNDKSGSC
jgi:hypothetical protein